MKTSKRKRVDSASEAQRIASSSAVVTPPSNVPLEDRDLPFFSNIIEEFARTEWTAHQLELAAMLARTMADLEEEQRHMRDEGSVVKTEKGTPVINPRKTAIQMHYSNIHSARRSLSLNARAQGGEARDIGKRRAATKKLEAMTQVSDGLLAS